MIGEDIGAVTFKNFKLADNKVGGFEITKLVSIRDGISFLEDAVIVG